MLKASIRREGSPGSLFVKYVAQNILGQIGMSAYILVDTYFISRAEGADGIAALNLVLPFFNLIYGFGAMYAVGSATRYTILKARGEDEHRLYFGNAVITAAATGLLFLLIGQLFSGTLIRLLGGDERIVSVGTGYMRIFMSFAPFFMLNQIFNAFTRNDGAPTTAMLATLLSGVFNMIFDYIFMFPMGMGMAGAALATVFAPFVGIIVCSTHLFSGKSGVRLIFKHPELRLIHRASELGMSAFIGEIAGGITTVVFNYLILRLAGNVGVAAYGVICNIALVVTCVFNGIIQGAQPLFSRYYGEGRGNDVKTVHRLAQGTAFIAAAVFIMLFRFFPEEIAAVFNTENNKEMAELAANGMRLYFWGYLFAGFNIISSGYLGATEKALSALFISLSRGVLFILICAVLLSMLFGMNGIWAAFTTAELLTAVLSLYALGRRGGSRGGIAKAFPGFD